MSLPLVAAAQAPSKPMPAVTPAPGAPKPATATTAPNEPDPWKGRTDLFIPPNLQPTTKVNIGALSRSTTQNGISLVTVPRHQIASVDVTLAIRVPDTAEPIDKTGVAQFTASMLRKGTAKRTADQISDAIDFVGGGISAQAEGGAIYVSCHARSRDLGLCLDLVSDLAINATFPEKEMGEARDQLMATVNGVKDNPNELATWHAANVFYGDDDPRGRPMSKKSIEAITRADLVAFRDKWFAPNNAILAVSGDVDEKALKPQLQKTFGAWKKHDVPPVMDPPARPMPMGKTMPVRLVDKPDATQSVILLLGPGIRRADPSYYAVRLMNYTLGGGGFSSRLMKTVRSEGGKTYGVSSRFDAGRDAGPFMASTFTRNAETTSTLKLVLDEIAKMKSGGPTEEELKAAKNNMIGGYGLRLETGSDLAEALIGAEIDGLDSKYVTEYPSRLDAITVREATTAAQQHLEPRALVVIGKAAEVGPLLKKAGYAKIEVMNYLDPVSGAERRAAQAARSASAEVLPVEAMEGRRLLELALQARGGQAALGKVQTLAMSGKGMVSMGGQQMPLSVDVKEIRGKASREEMDMGGMQVKIVVGNGKAYMQQGDMRKDAAPEMRAELEKALFRDPNFIVLNALQPGVKIRGLKPTAIGAVSYDTLEIISVEGDAYRLFLDPKSHQVTRMQYLEEQKQVTDELGDYRIVEGVSFPFKFQHGSSGQQVDIQYDKIVVNPKLAADLFQ
ncbi:MAG TPA: pitrilysin family protein [Polyangia bacterium]